MKIDSLELSRLSIPLSKPYARSYRTDHTFEPIMLELRDRDGRSGWADATVTTGYTHETIEGAWNFLRAHCAALVGCETGLAKERLLRYFDTDPNAVSIGVAAIEMLEGDPVLEIREDTQVPLLCGLSTTNPTAVAEEVEEILFAGFRTIKIKVGFDVDADLRIVRAAQSAVGGRAVLRLDANRGFSREDGCRFASSLDATDIMLFEQPCGSDDWAANAAVAFVSAVPIMLDESIYGLDDIDRAAAIPGIGFIKLKLKKAGGLNRLRTALMRIRQIGAQPVLGDGVSTETSCWMEACVARETIDNAGEMNGFLRCRDRLFCNPMPFANGSISLPAGYRPELDHRAVAEFRLTVERFATGRT